MENSEIIESSEQFQKIKLELAEKAGNGSMIIDVWKTKNGRFEVRIGISRNDQKNIEKKLAGNDIVFSRQYLLAEGIVGEILKGDGYLGKLSLVLVKPEKFFEMNGQKSGKNILIEKNLEKVWITPNQVEHGSVLRTLYTIEKTSFGNYRVKDPRSFSIDNYGNIISFEIYVKNGQKNKMKITA
ncbi:MAG: hypothetical protein WC501_01280 [Candidatus Micrarchaeia archaeon]